MRILLIFFFLSYSILYAQNDKDLIKWDPERPITWSDFKGKPKGHQHELTAAMCYSGIHLGFIVNTFDEVVEFEISGTFFIKNSWVDKKRANAELLVHERLHFDITELYARILKKRLTGELKPGTHDEVVDQVIKIHDEVDLEKNKRQDLYDQETNHSINEEEQKMWNAQIEKEIAELDAYSQTAFTVSIASKQP